MIDSVEMSSSPFKLLRLDASHVALLRQLNFLFGEAFADSETYHEAPPDDAYLARLLGRPDIVVLVALKDCVVVGGLVAYELEKFEQVRREYYIYDLAIAKAYRRQGIASALIGRLRELATLNGAWTVYVQADMGDEPAIALYEKLGTREEVLHFDFAVPGGKALGK
jgi:aminoglycoside 3-N-acetyltransferase I